MDILVPIQDTSNFYDFLNAGGTEFFCGYVTDKWLSLFNNVSDKLHDNMQISINKRDSLEANFQDLESLKKLVQLSEENDAEVFVVVNNTIISGVSYKYLKEYFEELASVNVKNIIVSDVGLINYLHKNFPDFLLTVSCLNQVVNCAAVGFYNNFNVRRIVYPRHISITEAVDIAKKYPEIEFEAFGLCEKCAFDDGNCRCIHNAGFICHDYYCKNYTMYDKKMNEEVLNKNAYLYEKWSDLNYDPNGNGVYNLGCSLCSLYNMLQIKNINSIKLSGRGINKQNVLNQIKLTKQIIDSFYAGKICDADSIKFMIEEKFGEGYCNNNFHCIMKGK